MRIEFDDSIPDMSLARVWRDTDVRMSDVAPGVLLGSGALRTLDRWTEIARGVLAAE